MTGYGSIRVVIDVETREIHVRRWGHRFEEEGRGAIRSAEVEELLALVAAVSQDEQDLIVGDFFAIGEETLEIRVHGREIRIHNDTERVRTPGAEPVLTLCYALADRHCPRRTPRP